MKGPSSTSAKLPLLSRLTLEVKYVDIGGSNVDLFNTGIYPDIRLGISNLLKGKSVVHKNQSIHVDSNGCKASSI